MIAYGVVLLRRCMYYRSIFVGEAGKVDAIFFRVQRLEMSERSCRSAFVLAQEGRTTRLPDLQLYNRKVSSSDAVRTWSPLSSKVMDVMCRGPVEALELLPGDGGGTGSTACLNTLAGFNLVCNPSAVTRCRTLG